VTGCRLPDFTGWPVKSVLVRRNFGCQARVSAHQRDM